MERDAEVESVLAEIRRQLRASADGQQPTDRRRQALAQLEADLQVTGRAWNRLPPVVSDRRDTAGRLELWVKRQLRRATHWLTWEQINFNAAVNDALRLTHSLLAEREAELAELRARVEALEADAEELRSLREEVELLRGEANVGGPAR
ncbi:MAG TPA: hypothetical protein VK421_11815 [Pyrinomonadaceae bacterium]|nr:hypothetical protein [Pyrinomonadaceae bacterium]